MKKTNRRNFIGKSAAAAAAGAAVAATPAAAQTGPARKTWGIQPGRPTPLFSSATAYGNLLFISGRGAHVPGDIKSHTKIVLDDIQQQLEACGSSMQKVLKATVFLANGKDYADMNSVFQGRFGAEPPVRTTVAAAWVPGDSLVEIDVIAYI